MGLSPMRVLTLRRSICIPVLLLAVAGGSCSSQPEVAEEMLLVDYPTLPGRFAEEGVLEPLIAADAFIGDDEANRMRSRAMRDPWRV